MSKLKSPGLELYERQVKFLHSRDIEGLINSNYSENAVLVSFNNTIQGQIELKNYFKDYLENLGSLKVLSTDKFTEIEDGIFFEATVDTEKYGVVHVFDAMIFRESKITHHFTGVK